MPHPKADLKRPTVKNSAVEGIVSFEGQPMFALFIAQYEGLTCPHCDGNDSSCDAGDSLRRITALRDPIWQYSS